jgi:hypothetical protein
MKLKIKKPTPTKQLVVYGHCAPDGDAIVPVQVEVDAVAGPAPKTMLFSFPLKSDSPAYLECLIDDKPICFLKQSLKSFKVDDGIATMEVPRIYAKRKGLLAA